MKYIEIIDLFKKEGNYEQIEFLDKCLNHIEDKKVNINLDTKLGILFII